MMASRREERRKEGNRKEGKTNYPSICPSFARPPISYHHTVL
jgi:hypothetical protein